MREILRRVLFLGGLLAATVMAFRAAPLLVRVMRLRIMTVKQFETK